MRRFTHKLSLFGATALLAIGLAACSSATTSTTAAQPTAAASTQTTAVATSAPAATTSSTAATISAPTTEATSAPAATTSSTAATNTKLNLNTATEEQLLAAIPNFPNRMVREFMEYRPYVSIQQFRKEIGKYVSADQVTTWEQYVYVPIDVDNADAATLQQIPGVDATIAQALIDGKPYGSTDTFLAKLGEYLPAADLQQAQAYLNVA